MNDAGLAAMRKYLEDSGLITNMKPSPLPVTLIIDAGHVVFTLYGTPMHDDKEYFAQMTTLVHALTAPPAVAGA